MCHTCPLHLEPFEGPITGGDRPGEATRDEISILLQGQECVMLCCSRFSFQVFVDGGSDEGIECFEKIFEEE